MNKAVFVAFVFLLPMLFLTPSAFGQSGLISAEEFNAQIEKFANDSKYIDAHTDFPVLDKAFYIVYGDMARGNVTEALRIFNDPGYPETVHGPKDPTCMAGFRPDFNCCEFVPEESENHVGVDHYCPLHDDIYRTAFEEYDPDVDGHIPDVMRRTYQILAESGTVESLKYVADQGLFFTLSPDAKESMLIKIPKNFPTVTARHDISIVHPMVATSNGLELPSEMTEDDCFSNYEVSLQNATVLELIYTYPVEERYIVGRTIDSDCHDRTSISDMVDFQVDVRLFKRNTAYVEKYFESLEKQDAIVARTVTCDPAMSDAKCLENPTLSNDDTSLTDIHLFDLSFLIILTVFCILVSIAVLHKRKNSTLPRVSN